MSISTSNIQCTDCGSSVDTSKDTPGRTPCPKCGSVKRTVTAAPQLFNNLLDDFVAHKLSLLTKCGAPEVADESNWLDAFIWTTVFKTGLDAKERAYLFNFVRRAQGAWSAYRVARTALIEHIETPRNVFSPYFKALLNFEVCISQCYQGYELLMTASPVKEKLYEPNDDSDGERLQKLYIASKHMDQRIAGGKLPTEATAAIWITNDGLESSNAKLSFEELVGMLLHVRRLSETLSTPPKAANVTPDADAPPSGAPVARQ